MSFRRLHLSFTERRRRRLAKKVDQLDRLESRTTITEPLSFTGLALSATGVLARLGFMYPDGANHALNALARAKDAAKNAGGSVAKPYTLPAKLLKSIDALAVGQIAGAGDSSAAGASGTSAHPSSSEAPTDWLTLTPKMTAGQARFRRNLKALASREASRRRAGPGTARRLRRFAGQLSRGTRCNHPAQAAPVNRRCRFFGTRRRLGRFAGRRCRRQRRQRKHRNRAGRHSCRPLQAVSTIHAGAGAASGQNNPGGGGGTFTAAADPAPDVIRRRYVASRLDPRPGDRQFLTRDPGRLRAVPALRARQSGRGRALPGRRAARHPQRLDGPDRAGSGGNRLVVQLGHHRHAHHVRVRHQHGPAQLPVG